METERDKIKSLLETRIWSICWLFPCKSVVSYIKMKFVLVVICAMILAASSQMISLDDLLRAYDISNNEIGTGENSVKVANEALFIPMSLRSCTSGACNFVCKFLGYKYGTCVSSETCRCYT